MLPQLTAEARLHFLPDRQNTPELGFSALGQTQPSFSTVFAAALGDPALPAHDGERSRQACAVHRQHFAQLSLRHLSGTRERLQDGELRSPQPKRTHRLLVELGNRPRRAAEVPAHARHLWQTASAHINMDAYTSIVFPQRFTLICPLP